MLLFLLRTISYLGPFLAGWLSHYLWVSAGRRDRSAAVAAAEADLAKLRSDIADGSWTP